ncbi:MAG: hypothetical protein ABIV50_13550 [Opitutus sp.]
MLLPYAFRTVGFVFCGIVLAASASATPLFDAMRSVFENNYGIQLVADQEQFPVEGTGGTITGRNTGTSNGDMVLYFLRKEFAKYPAELVRRSGVRRIVLCRDLKSGETRIAGVAAEVNATIYFDSTASVGNESHRRRTLHHEFFHFLDYARGGDVMNNDGWEAINRGSVSYGSAPPPMKPGQSDWATHPAPGFISDYSLNALPEDRAELFAGMMTNNLKLRLLVQSDQKLAAKVGQLKTEVQQLCPAMNESFWAEIAKF